MMIEILSKTSIQMKKMKKRFYQKIIIVARSSEHHYTQVLKCWIVPRVVHLQTCGHLVWFSTSWWQVKCLGKEKSNMIYFKKFSPGKLISQQIYQQRRLIWSINLCRWIHWIDSVMDHLVPIMILTRLKVTPSSKILTLIKFKLAQLILQIHMKLLKTSRSRRSRLWSVRPRKCLIIITWSSALQI